MKSHSRSKIMNRQTDHPRRQNPASGLQKPMDRISSCRHAAGIYTVPLVRLQRKTLQLALAVAVVGLTAGCGGVRASKSVSPLDFILPGLMKYEPAPAPPAGSVTNSVQLVAQVR